VKRTNRFVYGVIIIYVQLSVCLKFALEMFLFCSQDYKILFIHSQRVQRNILSDINKKLKLKFSEPYY